VIYLRKKRVAFHLASYTRSVKRYVGTVGVPRVRSVGRSIRPSVSNDRELWKYGRFCREAALGSGWVGLDQGKTY